MERSRRYETLKARFRSLCRIVNAVGGLLLITIMVMITADVISRSLFDSPIDGVFEVVELLMASLVSLGLAHAGVQGAHVTVDFLVSNLSATLQRVIDLINHLISAVLFGAICWKSLEQALKLKSYETTTVLLEIRLYPFLIILGVGAGLLGIVYLFYFTDRVIERKS